MRLWQINLVAAVLVATQGASAQDRHNWFDDPFVQLTAAMASCPVPEAPLLTLQERRAEEHLRVEKGTSCFLFGRCRLPNAYLYDKDIIARVGKMVARNQRFADSSLWVEGQRRWVFLKGCVRTPEQAVELEQAVRQLDDVESVINLLMVGVDEAPRYRLVAPEVKP
jgi:BON domain